ncbi:MAG: type II toxin-antitoxin system RelE/ParE family toxin [Bryobacteraceae bacterium]
MAFEVKYSARAEKDLDDILGWLLAQGAGETGLRWFEGLRKAVGTLTDLPQRCLLARENDSVPFEMRQLLYGRRPHVYRILFTIEGSTVSILRIRHGRRENLSAHSSAPATQQPF